MNSILLRTAVFVAALSLLGRPLAHAAETVSPAFNDLTFEAAGQKAAAESKIVFVDFYTTWCGPCKMLDQSTWQDAAVIDLLRAKAVAIKIDAEKEKTLAARYKIAAYPTLLLLKPDGTEIDRLVGYREARTFIAEFNSGLAGKTALQRAQEAVKGAATDQDRVQARYKLARLLALDGKNQEALDEFLWCYDEGMKQAPGMHSVRNSFLLSDMANLGRDFPPALTALRERRDKALAAAQAPDASRDTLMDLASLNRTLKEDAKTLEFFDRLPADDVRRDPLGLILFPQLLEAKRYADAAKAQPYERIAQTFAVMQKVESTRDPSRMPERLRQLMHENQIKWLAEHVEMLAGSGQTAEAKELLATALNYDHSDEAKATFRQHLERAGHPELFDNPATNTTAPAPAAAPATATQT